MPPNQILFIRHGEEHAETGITETGRPDEHSLTVRGWQRAGALVGLFGRDERSGLRPDAIYASSVAPGSESWRPGQTVAPLVAYLQAHGGLFYNDAYGKNDIEALMADVLTRSGTVLIAWEHSRIADCIAALPGAPETPGKWPSERYDLVWQFRRNGEGWIFREVPQLLLSGDADP
ncbi:MAG: phosphoglycerate mutase family protein [Janthinobacterium lividum]